MAKMKLFFLLVLVCGLMPVMATERIKFNGEFYTLQEVVKTPTIQDGYRNTYVRENETPQNWNKMIVIQTYPNLKDPEQAIKRIRQKYPSSPAAIHGNYTVAKHGLIFSLILLNMNNGKPVYENNLIRFEEIKNAGLISYQYIERFPITDMNNTKAVLDAIAKDQAHLTQLVKKLNIPSIKKEKNP
ncbi:MAG: hypothetical protein J6Y85_02650 [Alphaproteobacteria bacterium]|nr:hypothetical protein [Alphaproteobacteria bacterium]